MGYSIQKEMILNILHGTKQHHSVHGIHKELTKMIPAVSLMTVYRNLKQLTGKGKIFEHHINNKAHYCGNREDHGHLYCISCNVLINQKSLNIKKLNIDSIELTNFKPLPNGLVVKGFCNNCII